MSEADFGLTGKGSHKLPDLKVGPQGNFVIDSGNPTSGNPGNGDVISAYDGRDNRPGPTSPKASGPIK